MAYALTYKSNGLLFTLSTLLLWTLVGFIYNLDNNTQWGCVDDNVIFSFHNVSLSALSLSLLSLGYIYRKQRPGKWLITAEATFWIYKLFFVKGGYVVGTVAAMPITIVMFDFVALALRLLLIKQLFSLPYKSFIALIIASLLMILKLQFFR